MKQLAKFYIDKSAYVGECYNDISKLKLFDELVEQFLKRNGGYTRIYKLMSRVGDGAPVGLIQLVEAVAERRRSSKKSSKKSVKVQENSVEVASEVENSEKVTA